MAIRDFHIQTTEVPFTGGSFTVHGVSFDELTRLATDATADVMAAIDAYEEMTASGNDSGEAIIGIVLAKAPDLAARLIANAADEPDLFPTVRKMPLSVQMNALEAIFRLTFEEPEALKKFSGQILTLLNSVKNLAPKKPITSAAASGG